MVDAWQDTILVPPSTNWYSSGIACVGPTYHAFAAYNYVILYDHDCITVKAILRAHSNKVTAVAAADSSGHQVVLSSGRDKVAIAWSVERHSFVRKQKLPGEPTALIACPHDHNKAILALTTGSCVVWDWSKGGTAVYDQALPESPVAILRDVGSTGAVLAGCEDGTLAVVDSKSCKQLWSLPPAPVAAGKPQSGSRKGPGPKNTPPPCGIEDISITTVPLAAAAPRGTRSSPADDRSLTLLAVSTRAAQVALFAWPAQQGPSSRPWEQDQTHWNAAVPQHVAGAEEAAQHTQQGCTASASAQTLERPRWLKTLQVPRGSSSTAQVVWTPVCWLPPQSAATRADSKHAEAAQAGDADSTSTSTPLQVAWLLAGLPNGGVMLWKVSVDTGHLAMSAAAVCVGQGSRSGPPPRPPQRSPGKAAADGTWRPRSAGCAESPASEAAWHGAGGRATGEVGGSWRQAAAATVERGTVQMPDVHARMLFTLHAIPEAAGGPAQQWRLVSTSYDRKIVSWLLQLDQARAAARLEPQMIWHGTAAVVSCMCALPGDPSLFVATADKTIRGFGCRITAATPASIPASTPPGCPAAPPLLLTSKTSSLYHQGIPADVAAVTCAGGLLAAGCADGSVGLMSTGLAASKARFAAFAAKHAATVRHCIIRTAGAAGGTAVNMADHPLFDGVGGVAADVLDGNGVDGTAAAAGSEQGFLELLSVGQDSRIILWRGFPSLAEVHSMLRTPAGVIKLGTMATPQDVLSLLHNPPAPLHGGATCACASADVLFVGTQQGQLAAIVLPSPGEHSANTALRAPPPELVLLRQLHGAAITAVATIAAHVLPGSSGLSHCIVAAAASSGAVALAKFHNVSGGEVATLVMLCMLSDVKKSITALLFSECSPQHPEGGRHPSEVDVSLASEGCMMAAAGDAEGAPGAACAAAAATLVSAAGRMVLLFASEHAGRVHRWRIALTQHAPEICTPDADGNHATFATGGHHGGEVATYCGALERAGGSSSPVAMCAVSTLSSQCGSAAHVCDSEDPGPHTQLPRCVWLLVGCADRSVRGWPVTAALAAPPPAPAAEPVAPTESAEPPADERGTTAAVQAPRAIQAECATAELDSCVLPPEDLPVPEQSPLREEARVSPVVMLSQAASVLPDQQAQDMHDGAEIGGADHSGCDAGGAMGVSLSGGAGGRISGASSAAVPGLGTGQPTDGLLKDADHDAAAAHAELEQAASAQAHLSLSNSRAVAELVHAAVAAAPAFWGRGVPAAHGRGSERPATARAALPAVQGVGCVVSRFVGVRSSDSARHRPRATALGHGSLMSEFVDEGLTALSDIPGGHFSGLPGANSSGAVADAALESAAAVDMRTAAADASSKSGSSARLASIVTAHRAALHLLLRGQTAAALDRVIAADALNADFVALSAAAGPAVWRAVVALHAARLEACGEVHLAAAYLCSARDFEGAALAYGRAGLLLEAVSLAERHLAPGAVLLKSLRQQLAAQLLRAGDSPATLRWRGEVIASAGSLGEAVSVALQVRHDHESLMHACGLAQAAGAVELAAELAVRAALESRTAVGQEAGVRLALDLDVGMAAVGAAVGTVASLLEAWLLLMVQTCGGERWAELEHAVSAAAAASQRHMELLGLADNNRAALHGAKDGAHVVPCPGIVPALAMELMTQVVKGGPVNEAASMYTNWPETAAFPPGLHVMPALYGSPATSHGVRALTLFDMETVMPEFARAVEHSVRSCLRPSRLVHGSALQSAAMGVLQRHAKQLLRPVEVEGVEMHAGGMSAAFCIGTSFRASAVLVHDALAHMADATAVKDSASVLAHWQAYVEAQMQRFRAPVRPQEEYGGAPVDEAAAAIPWVAAIDAFVEAAASGIAGGPPPDESEGSGIGRAEVKEGTPEVHVSADALRELDRVVSGSMVAEPGAESPAQPTGWCSVDKSRDSVHAEHACGVDRGQFERSDKRCTAGNGRRRAARAGGGAAKEGLTWQEVVAYQASPQAFGPDDWARFRTEALGLERSAAAVGTRQLLYRDAADERLAHGEDVATDEVWGCTDEAVMRENDDRVMAGGFSAGSSTTDGDVVLNSWMSALASYPEV